MAEIIPFRGICYNSEKVEAGRVVAPPYDVISPDEKALLYEKSPYNIARVDAGAEFPQDTETENKYTRAAALLNKWIDEGVLQLSERPSLYLYQTDYEVKGEKKRLRGFFSLVKLEPFGEGSIYPHEATHSVARVDRLKLLRATKTNTSPIFSVYESPERRASRILDKVACSIPPSMSAADKDCAVHSLWVIDDPGDMEEIKKDLEGKPVFIADGHHRYETALENQRLMKKELGDKAGGDEPFNYVLMFLANVVDNGLTILPTHRLVKTGSDILKTISNCFEEEEELPASADILGSIKGRKNTFGLYANGKKYRAVYKGNCEDLSDVHPSLRKLDVVVLQELVINRLIHANRVGYEMDAQSAVQMVDSGRYDAAFFLNPTGIKDVMGAALSGQRMPPKSTYFYPKLMTGFVMNRF